MKILKQYINDEDVLQDIDLLFSKVRIVSGKITSNTNGTAFTSCSIEVNYEGLSLYEIEKINLLLGHYTYKQGIKTKLSLVETDLQRDKLLEDCKKVTSHFIKVYKD